MHADETGVNRLSERITGCAFQVLNTLGAGLLEKVYENAAAHELRKSGLTVAQQRAITVSCDGVFVGDCRVDLLAEGTIIVELKATGPRLCPLRNFGKPRPEIQRVVHGP